MDGFRDSGMWPTPTSRENGKAVSTEQVGCVFGQGPCLVNVHIRRAIHLPRRALCALSQSLAMLLVVPSGVWLDLSAAVTVGERPV